jgi:hypothetical protein
MSRARKAKKRNPALRHWHWNPRNGENECWLHHSSGWKLQDGRERRKAAAGRRRMRRDIRKGEVRRYGKSRLPISHFVNITIDASNFIAAIKRMQGSIEALSLSWDTIKPIVYKEVSHEAPEAAREQDRESALGDQQTPVEPGAAVGELEEATGT